MINKALKVTKSFETTVNKEAVWNAIVNPDIIKQYLFGTETISNWEKGAEIIFQGEFDGQAYLDKGIILDIQENELLTYSYWSGFSGLEDLPENYSTVSFHISASNDKTMLTMTQEGFANEQAHEHSNNSWQMVLDLMKSIIEKG